MILERIPETRNLVHELCRNEAMFLLEKGEGSLMSLPPLAIGMGIVTGLCFGVNVRSLLWLFRMPLLDVR